MGYMEDYVDGKTNVTPREFLAGKEAGSDGRPTRRIDFSVILNDDSTNAYALTPPEYSAEVVVHYLSGEERERLKDGTLARFKELHYPNRPFKTVSDARNWAQAKIIELAGDEQIRIVDETEPDLSTL